MHRAAFLLYTVVALLAALLLFWVELLCGRLLLPLFGGTPAVWNACLFFFQAALLLGYLWAHALDRRLPPRAQVAAQVALLAVAGLALPVAVPSGWVPVGDEPPIPRLLALLAVILGGPFVALSASAPLLQGWFARPGRDPYPLYAASNLGSLLGLLAYPFAIERATSLAGQGRLWAAGYGACALATLVCGLLAARSAPAAPGAADDGPAPDGRQRARWLLRAFVPACLLYGVTATITRDIAPVPLLWIVPLALYLASLVLAFARRELIPRAALAAVVPLLLAWMVLTSLVRYPFPVWLNLPLHALGAFAASWLLHGDLARERPAPRFLTGFYLWIAGGGLLAGVFCALLAPLLLRTALEYPAMAMLAALLVPGPANERGARRSLLLVLGVTVPVLLAGFTPRGLAGNAPAFLLAAPLALAVAWAFPPRGALRGALAFALFVAIAQTRLGTQEVLLEERSFFGLHRVVREKGFLHYESGLITHGRQAIDPARRMEPLAYFHPRGPIGGLFRAWCDGPGAGKRVAVMGLGIGSLAAYARPEQTWRFYEVDPQVEAIAKDARFFSYLADARVPCEVVLGDGRLSLAREAARGEPPWDLLMLDAFNSDSVPVHLLTREAFALYLSRLAPGGVLILNTSNRYLSLDGIVARLADEHGLVGLLGEKPTITADEKAAGLSPCQCVVLARSADALRFAEGVPGLAPLDRVARARLWTDDHADLLGALRLR